MVGAGRRAVAARIDDRAAAEQRVEEALRAADEAAAAVYCAPQLFCAKCPISARRWPSWSVAAAFELLEIAHHAVEIAAHLLDLRGERSALRRQAENSAKKSFARAAGFVRLRDGAVEIGLLLGDGVFGAFDLVGARRVGGALVDRGKLAFKAHANRIRRLPRWSRSGL